MTTGIEQVIADAMAEQWGQPALTTNHEGS